MKDSTIKVKHIYEAPSNFELFPLQTELLIELVKKERAKVQNQWLKVSEDSEAEAILSLKRELCDDTIKSLLRKEVECDEDACKFTSCDLDDFAHNHEKDVPQVDRFNTCWSCFDKEHGNPADIESKQITTGVYGGEYNGEGNGFTLDTDCMAEELEDQFKDKLGRDIQVMLIEL